MEILQALNSLAIKEDLSEPQMRELTTNLLANRFSTAQMAALLMGLTVKGIQLDELLGAAGALQSAMCSSSPKINHFARISLLGKSAFELFNLPVACAFVAAAAGSRVSLHDGSPFLQSKVNADLLQAFGIKIPHSIDFTLNSLRANGLGFSFANAHALDLKFSAQNELKFSSIFNELSLLACPFKVDRHFIGVNQPEKCLEFAKLFKSLGAEHAFIVHSSDGLDAISLSGKTYVAEFYLGELREFEITPAEFGIETKSLMGLNQPEIEDSHLLIKDALGNRRGHYAEKAADIITLNAGALIYVSGVANSLQQGVNLAREVIANTRAGEKIREVVAFS